MVLDSGAHLPVDEHAVNYNGLQIIMACSEGGDLRPRYSPAIGDMLITVNAGAVLLRSQRHVEAVCRSVGVELWSDWSWE